jgi:hypothetical protein
VFCYGSGCTVIIHDRRRNPTCVCIENEKDRYKKSVFFLK